MATLPGFCATRRRAIRERLGVGAALALAAVFEAIGGTTFWLLAEGEAQF